MTKHGKTKNDKDKIENILYKHVLPVYDLAQKGDGTPEFPLLPLDPPMSSIQPALLDFYSGSKMNTRSHSELDPLSTTWRRSDSPKVRWSDRPKATKVFYFV